MQRNTAQAAGKEFSWNLPPIDMKALKLPQQFSGGQNSDKKKIEQNVSSLKNKSSRKSMKQDKSLSQGLDGMIGNKKVKPKFSLSGSPSDSSQSGSQSPISDIINSANTPPIMPLSDHLSTRPSEIDLHEMKLSSNQNSSNDLSQMIPTSNQSQAQPSWLRPFGNQSSGMPFSSDNNQSQQNQSGFPQSQAGSLPSMQNQTGSLPLQFGSQQNQSGNLQNQFSSHLNQSGSLQNQFGNQQTQSGIVNNQFGNQQTQSGLMHNQFGNQQNQSGSQQNVGFQQPVQPTQKKTSRSNSGIFNPGLPNMTGSNEIKSGSGAVNQSQVPQQGQRYTNNQENTNLYGDSGSGFMNMQSNNRNNTAGFGNQSNFQNQTGGFGNQNSGFGNTGPQQNSDNMADFTMSGIHNNSSFLSELTDADDNFLSQLDAGSDQNSQSSVDSSQMMNQSASGISQNTGMGNQSGTMGSQSGNIGMPNYQQGNMNFDMFSNQQQQQNPNFFPNFGGNSQFNRSNSFGNQQNMNMSQQGGFPGGSMYPMGGMMQPSMFPYAPFAPYPYAPMMAPMPYYPMPFQPQYGGQGGNMGQQTGNLGQQGPNMSQPGANVSMPMGQQGTENNSFQPGMGGQ